MYSSASGKRIEAILDDPIVAGAVRALEPLVDAPKVVPDLFDAPADARGQQAAVALDDLQ